MAAQILLGAYQATMFPHAVKDKTGSLHQIGQARLMQSEITGKYIIFGSCHKHTSHSRRRNTWIRSNQVHENKDQDPDQEVLVSIMGSINLDNVDQIETNPSQD